MTCNKANAFLRKAEMLILVPVVLVVTFLLPSCVVSQVQRAQYLSDPSNYISITGVVKVIDYSDDKKTLYIIMANGIEKTAVAKCLTRPGANDRSSL